MKRTRGLGIIFQQPGSANWWIQFSVRGKRFRESSRSANRADAVRLLKKKIAAVQAGRPVGPDVEKTTVGALAAILTDEYIANDRGVHSIKAPLAHLLAHFGADCAAINVTTDAVTRYITVRQEHGAKNGTINRSLAALKRAFRLAERAGKVARVPHIPMLEENNARQGFVTNAEFERLRDALPADLKDPVEFLYRSGWRVGEMRSLEWRDVKDGTIRLRAENSKNKHGRVLPLTRELAAIIDRAAARRRPEVLSVFHRGGKQIGLFRKSWATACRQAGLGAILVHDLRRSCIKNMIDAGIKGGEKTAMMLSGHRTRSVFDRYNIITEDTLVAALEQVSDHLAAQPRTAANVVPFKRPG